MNSEVPHQSSTWPGSADIDQYGRAFTHREILVVFSGLALAMLMAALE